MTPVAQRYFDEVEGLLRARNVPEDAIASSVDDLRERVVSSGTHPYTEFGEPEDVANRIADASGVSASGGVNDRPVLVSFGFAAIALIVDGGIGVRQSHKATFGIEPFFVVAIGIVFALVVGWAIWRNRVRTAMAGPWWVATAIVAVAMGIAASAQIVNRLQ